MSDYASAGLVLTAIGGIFVYLIAASVLHRRKRINADEVRRQRERAAEREADKREERDREVRRVARERARIAYPELLDAQEADRDPDPIGPFGEYETQDCARIQAACGLVTRPPRRGH